MEINIANEQPEPGLEPFVSEFLNDREQELSNLKADIDNHDFNNVRQLAHRWKGFCAPYGFAGLGTLSLELEHQAEEKNHTACLNIFKEISDYLHAKRLVIERHE